MFASNFMMASKCFNRINVHKRCFINSNSFSSLISKKLLSKVRLNPIRNKGLKGNSLFPSSKVLLSSLGIITAGSGTICLLFNGKFNRLTVCCDAAKHSRLIESKNDIEVEFDWYKLLELVKPEIGFIFIATVSALIVAALNIQIPLMLGELINTLTKFFGSSCVTQLTSFIDQIKTPGVKLIQLYIAQSIFTTLCISTLSQTGERMASRLRKELFSSILRQDIAFFDTHKTGEIISRLTADVQEFKSSFKVCVAQGLRSTTQAVGCVVSMYFISPKMTSLMVFVLPSLILVGSIIGTSLRKLSKEAQAQVAKAAAIADEAIGNIRTVRAFAMEEKEIE